MARIGLQGLTYAKVTSGGSGTPMVYSAGKQIDDNLRAANVTYNREDVKLNLDNHTVERSNDMTDSSVSIEIGKITEDIAKDMLGMVDSNGELETVSGSTPQIGFGYITKEVDHGAVSYTGHWFHKAIVSLDADNAATKEDTTAFGTFTLTAKPIAVQLEANGPFVWDIQKPGLADLAAARSWLNGKANIS